MRKQIFLVVSILSLLSFGGGLAYVADKFGWINPSRLVEVENPIRARTPPPPIEYPVWEIDADEECKSCPAPFNRGVKESGFDEIQGKMRYFCCESGYHVVGDKDPTTGKPTGKHHCER